MKRYGTQPPQLHNLSISSLTFRLHFREGVSNGDAGIARQALSHCHRIRFAMFTLSICETRIRQMQNEMALLRDLKGNNARHIDAVLRCENVTNLPYFGMCIYLFVLMVYCLVYTRKILQNTCQSRSESHCKVLANVSEE